MNKFYFTFGTSDSMPFRGGWVEVVADSRKEAVEKFCDRFGRTKYNEVTCSFIYEGGEFKETEMFLNNDNLGAACHLVIE